MRVQHLASIVPAVLAVLALLPAGTATATASSPVQWRTTLDHRDPPSYVVVRALASGVTYLHGQVAGLTAGATYTVTVRRGSCAIPAAPLFSLPVIRARADGEAVWTSTLTAHQARVLRAATTGSDHVSVRVGAGRCGTLARRGLVPSPGHRIGVRTGTGAAEFYDRSTGRRWVPRGNNYVHLAPAGVNGGGMEVDFSTFSTARYDPIAAERALRTMHGDGYNAIRVFLGTCCRGGIGDANTNELSAAYLDILVDFLERAAAYRIQVMPTLQWLPAIPRYEDLINSTCGTQFGVANCHYIAAGGLAANQRFFRDLIIGLKARGARLDAVWAWQLRNEIYFDSAQPPFTLVSGSVTAANGIAYDMANPADRQRIMDESLAWYVDRSREAIRAVDPTALVTVGFFVPQAPNPARPDDTRVIDPRPAYTSSLDFVDLHAYPGLDLTLEQLAQNYGLSSVPPAKPVVFAEMGAFRFAYPTPEAGAAGIVGWQVGSCPLGVEGWLTWTWNLTADPSLYTALERGGVIERALAPATRGDPCGWGAVPRDLSRGRAVTASAAVSGFPPTNAVDENGLTTWNSGGPPPQWLAVELSGPASVSQVLLHVARFPASGTTTDVVYGRVGDTWSQLATRTSMTSDDQWLVLAPPTPGAWANVSAVRVETTASDSWVAWRDIEVLGTPEP